MPHSKTFKIESETTSLKAFINQHGKIAITIEEQGSEYPDSYQVIEFDTEDCNALINELKSLNRRLKMEF